MTQSLRQLLTAGRAVLVLTVLLGICYPAVLLGVGGLGLHRQAQGSLVTHDGTVVGSSLIAQPFEGDGWFQPRPSAGDYDALASGGTNTGPSDAELVGTVAERRTEIAERDGVAVSQVPPDALTSSASGLDPYISPAYARLQIDRVAGARHLPVEQVRWLVEEHVLGRSWGFLGQPRVNVVELNLALQQQS